MCVISLIFKPSDNLMHHTMTMINNGSVALLVGGRASPYQPNQIIYSLQLDAKTNMWMKVQLHPKSDRVEPRWRHTASLLQLQNGNYLAYMVHPISF